MVRTIHITQLRMKRTSYQSGFTLVELLVVIAIIAVLSGLSTVAVQGLARSAKKNESKSIATAFMSALDRYHAEYGSFPPPIEKTSDDWDADTILLSTDTNVMPLLLAELLGEDADVNHKEIRFLDLDDAKAGKSGIVRDSSGVAEALTDAYGEAFNIVFNSDYEPDGIAIPSGYRDEGNLVKTRAMIYNAGRDATAGNTDDVCSWQ